MLEKLGIRPNSDEMVTDILMEVKERGTKKRGLLTLDEFKEIVESQTG